MAMSTLLVSCSKDAIADDKGIIGVWELAEFQVDAEAAGTYLNLAEDALNKLRKEDCTIVTFEFKNDATLITENAINYLNISAGPTGLVVPCPIEKDTQTTTYTYENGVIKFKDKDGDDVSAKATVDGNKMTVDAEGLDLPNFNTKGELVFKKK